MIYKYVERLIYMKHTFQASIIVVLMFIIAQFIGLSAINSYIDTSSEDGLRALPAGIERPDVSEQAAPILMIVGVILGTIIILILIKLNAKRAWSIWFGISVFILSFIALSAFIPQIYATILAIIFAILKTVSLKISWVIKNIPELFIYSGLAIIFAPLLNVWGAVLLLILISIYDMYAVWQSKHMVKLAKFQLDSGKFAGFNVSYKNKDNEKTEIKKVESKKVVSKIIKSKSKLNKNEIPSSNNPTKQKSAILGGGDVAFPLLLSSTLLLSVGWGFAIASSMGAAVGLATLLFLSVKDKFYPAMPFISLGCFLGIGLLWMFTVLL
jgi:presenilin-like A22 family membrane protease